MTTETAGDAVAYYIDLETQRRELEERLAELKRTMRGVEQAIVEDWGERGVQHVKTRGGTLHLRTDFVCSKKVSLPKKYICESLKALGLGDLVHLDYAPSAVKARIKEQLEEEGGPTDGLAELFDWQFLPRLVLRAG